MVKKKQINFSKNILQLTLKVNITTVPFVSHIQPAEQRDALCDGTSLKYPPCQSSPSTHTQDSTSTKQLKFDQFDASVSDAWSVDDLRINSEVAQSSARSVLDHHKATTQTVHFIGPPLNSYLNRVRALQRLATQKGEKYAYFDDSQFHSEVFSENSSCQPIYPCLPGFETDALNRKRNQTPHDSSETDHRVRRILNLIDRDQFSELDREELQRECWTGIPAKLRPRVWRLLSGYAPFNKSRVDQVLKQKRDEYFNLVEQYFHTRFDESHQDTFRQVFCFDCIIFCHQMFERILYIWAYRHQGSGYVQGMNDLVTPFFIVFLSEWISPDSAMDSFELTSLEREKLNAIEADSYWCITALLRTIQTNYTSPQSGIHEKIDALKALMKKMNSELDQHLQKHQVEYFQFAFRWMNNLLMREIPLSATIRLWDTYLCVTNGFANFHLYVCAAFLRYWSKEIQKQPDFQSILLFLQNLPTQQWDDDKIKVLTADAYSLMEIKIRLADARLKATIEIVESEKIALLFIVFL
ncbi:TBC1 domain family member 22B [Trichinella spiralis]|uniref:TBC1 domain family member n=1 Tax=Trichinella spiralis TaxID=6334 RepID=E5S6G8_TRISP|nr:TBC1 domain family member 22B [Trichinella spiralis]KRY36612.1 TBC1 domain family member [Trichinella spiralis]